MKDEKPVIETTTQDQPSDVRSGGENHPEPVDRRPEPTPPPPPKQE